MYVVDLSVEPPLVLLHDGEVGVGELGLELDDLRLQTVLVHLEYSSIYLIRLMGKA